MHFSVPHDAPGVQALGFGDAAAVVRQARALAGLPASAAKLLAGKQLALLSPDCGDEGANDFIQAALALGAHVSFVRPGLDERSGEGQVDALARVLGRLYDAVECQHLPASLVRRLAGGAGIPVFAGLATAGHPTAALVDDLDAGLPWQDRRRAILQAALLVGLA